MELLKASCSSIDEIARRTCVYPKYSGNMDTETLKSLNLIKKEIKREYKSLRNRLQSIIWDHQFLTTYVIPTFPDYPLVPNERCGLWYCNPESFSQTSYFKSTDGHINQWDFSTRRLNFHLLPSIAQHGGIVIIDSTRRGKKIPDALSKTIPVWCAVINTLILEASNRSEEVLFCPPGTVPQSEYDRIKDRIPSLVKKLKNLGIVSGDELLKQFGGKILRPLWVYPGSSLFSSSTDIFTGKQTRSQKWEKPEDQDFLPVILCTASYQCQDGVDKRYGFTYVQGAADDHELWAEGLTPDMFWDNKNFLGDETKSEQELIEYVNTQKREATERTKKASGNDLNQCFSVDAITKELHLGTVVDGLKLNEKLLSQLDSRYALTIVLSESVKIASIQENPNAKIYPLTSGSKKSSKELRSKLIEICPLIQASLNSPLPILICCNTGKDMSVGVLLATLCQNYEEDWCIGSPNSFNKTIIRKHLTRLISHLKGRNVNPSRATLNSVNAYLM